MKSLVLIRHGTVIDPGRYHGPGEVLIEGRTIKAIGRELESSLRSSRAVTTVDATGLLVLPGLIDLHVHLREPGFEYKETIETGTMAAVAGGFTSICCMPNTRPVNDNQAVTKFILAKAAASGKARVFPIGAITKGSEGKELAEIGELVEAGCVAISDDGRPVMNSSVMRRAMEYARAFDLTVVDHCEDLHLTERGCMNEGFVSTQLGVPGMPNAAEEIMVARNLALAELTGAKVHLAHVSTAGSVELLRRAKAKGLAVSAEVCPHHFTLTEEAARTFDTHAKMNPPLRAKADLEAVKAGLADGTIDVIATDHAPHAVQEKQLEFDAAPFGIVGLETALPLSLALVEEGVLTLEGAISKLTVEPARVFGLAKGTLAPGADADVILVDPAREWTVDVSRLFSKGRNTPFAGWMMRGKVVKTFVAGTLVYESD